jgi:hypothetical protein
MKNKMSRNIFFMEFIMKYQNKVQKKNMFTVEWIRCLFCNWDIQDTITVTSLKQTILKF